MPFTLVRGSDSFRLGSVDIVECVSLIIRDRHQRFLMSDWTKAVGGGCERNQSFLLQFIFIYESFGEFQYMYFFLMKTE